ncbi:MAG: NAD-dependent epimerase/dehydratase family protein [Flavobacterium sp.]|nr:NAD-dependent epimerase/dehydratase family protein [Flavobacterium sp.]
MVLVTGGTGLVGAHLLLHLIENGENVRAIYRNLESIQKTKNLFLLYKKEVLFEKIDWIQADIIDVPSLELIFENVEYVYHCAALISFDPKDEDVLRKTNIEGTANMVNFCIAKNVKKLCFLSSISALGDLKENEKIITEEAEWNPEKQHSDYAISKYGAEMEIWRGQQEGLETVIINPGVIIGPGFREQGSGKLFKKVANRLSFYTKGITGFISVHDVVEMAVKLMKNGHSNNRFTLVAENIAFQDLLNAIADSLNVKRPSIHASPFLVTLAFKIDWFLCNVLGQKRKLDRATAKASYTISRYSNEKIKTALQTEFLDIHQYIKDISKL